MRQQPPGTTTAQDIEDRVEHFAHLDAAMSAPSFLRWDEGGQDFPADIAEIGIIGLAIHG